MASAEEREESSHVAQPTAGLSVVLIAVFAVTVSDTDSLLLTLGSGVAAVTLFWGLLSKVGGALAGALSLGGALLMMPIVDAGIPSSLTEVLVVTSKLGFGVGIGYVVGYSATRPSAEVES